MESQSSIRTLFASSKSQRKALESIPNSSSAAYQETLRSAIEALDECRRLADGLSLFSSNETEDDIASGDLQYLLVDYYLAELTLKDTTLDRKTVLRRAQEAYERYLARLDTYSILSPSDKKLLDRYLDNRDEFSLMPDSSDPSKRRETKISRYKQEVQLKSKLEYLSQDPSALQTADDAAIRALHFAEIQLHIHNTFHTLDIIAQELKILSLAPSIPPTAPADDPSPDSRERQRQHPSSSYSSRLDHPLSQFPRGSNGPILTKDGKPLQPFTLLSSNNSNNRQQLRNGVFRSGHNLPTMTIDEYLAEEKRRGGMVEGGGEQSGIGPEPDEDDFDRADQETVKAREWDEFKEDNPRGSGNTLNRG